jgi:hypothetical protein
MAAGLRIEQNKGEVRYPWNSVNIEIDRAAYELQFQELDCNFMTAQ